jgi:hypothetical protein
MTSAQIDPDGYCRECRTKHGPWGHLTDVAEMVAAAIRDNDGVRG